MADLTIGALAKRTNTKVPTIRFYESIGLLPEPARTSGNQRRYGWKAAERLSFIRHARALGFELEDIRSLLGLADRPEASCGEIDAVAAKALADTRAKIAKLRALETELERITRACHGGRVADCRVIEMLADHEHCASEH